MASKNPVQFMPLQLIHFGCDGSTAVRGEALKPTCVAGISCNVNCMQLDSLLQYTAYGNTEVFTFLPE